MHYHQILRDYLRDHAMAAMLSQGWAYKPAKAYGSRHAERPEYHIDQPLRTHILNGLYAVTRVVEYLHNNRYPSLRENEYRRLLVLYTMHDAYKDSEMTAARMGNSSASIRLEALEALYKRMKLDAFVELRPEDLRVASISSLSPKIGDLSSGTPELSRMMAWIHMADALASQQTARDYKTAENRLYELTMSDAVFARQRASMSTRLGATAPIPDVLPRLKFHFHELDDYRGVSTLLIHQSTEEALAPYGLYPILYFANGVLYLGPETVTVDVEVIRAAIITTLFKKIRDEASSESMSIAREACDPRKGMKIEKYAYLFCSFEKLLDAVCEKSSPKKTMGFMQNVLVNRINKKKYRHADEFYTQYAIPGNVDANEAQAQRWFAISKLVMAAESIARSLVKKDTLEWLFSVFKTPVHIAGEIRQHSKLLGNGGISDHSYIIAYHWLQQTIFASDRTWLEVDIAIIQQDVSRLVLRALKPYEKAEHLLAFVEKELGFDSDTRSYLRANLTFSFADKRELSESPLKEYERKRTQSHKRACVICNRLIPASMNKKNSEIKTKIANQQARVFSNKLHPSMEVDSQMVWCPLCYLEFMLRKLSGLSYPADSDYNASYRLYLYVLPDYSFTPQLWEDTGKALLQHFYAKETVVSRLVLRGSKDEPSIPTRWLKQRTIDEEWLQQVQAMFARQAELLKKPNKDGKPRKKQGDRLTFSFKNPNYMLIPYDNVVSSSTDKSLAPTHIEVWTKALYAATLIHLLTGARVYITDKPYLNITRPEQMKTIIEMEGLHPLLYGLLPLARTDSEGKQSHALTRASESAARLPIAALPTLLDLLAAVWEINAGLTQSKPNEYRNLDKQVAGVLEEIRSNYLAGATLYKMREREREAYEIFTRACRLLLPQQREQADEYRRIMNEENLALMMDKEGEDLMNLARKITDTSLSLYIPLTKREGRAHRYESLFRTGVEVIKTNALAGNEEMHEEVVEELTAQVGGNMLKRLDRISGGVCPAHGDERARLVHILAELLVIELYQKRCGGSVSKLTHQENALADAVYFITSQQISARWHEWKEYKKLHPKEAAAAEAETVASDDLVESEV